MKKQDNTDPRDEKLEALGREVRYLRQQAERTVSRLLRVDLQSIAIRHELEHKRKGFSLMADLATALGRETDHEVVFVSVSRRINAALNMQRTAVLASDPAGGFSAVVLQGYPPEAQKAILGLRMDIPAVMLDPLNPVLVTGADSRDQLAAVREALALPYLISSPIVLRGDIVALLVTGRLVEERPSLPRLGKGDVETIQAASGYLTAMLAGSRLRHAEFLANHDPLTRLPNLRAVEESLRRTLEQAQLGNYRAAILFVDFNDFKVINDTRGHAAGDVVLRVLSERLVGCVRDSDVVGRIGGDEFIVILSRIRQLKDAVAVAAKITGEVSRVIDTGDGGACQITASIGIAIFPEHGKDGKTLLQAADEAMYRAKKSDRNTFCCIAGEA